MDERERALAHLRLVAAWPGYWELRALRRIDGARMEARGSFFVIATTHGNNLIYDRLTEAVDWADEQARDGAEIFLGVNPRAREHGKSKDAVEQLTACFADLDMPEGETIESLVSHVTDGDAPLPSLMVHSGYGVHVLYLLSEPATDKLAWRTVQRGLLRRWSDIGADPRVASDESRVLRLVPYPNRKKWPEGRETSILYQSEHRYTLEQLANAFTRGTAFSPNEVLSFQPPQYKDETGTEIDAPDDEDLQALAERAERNRAILDLFIQRNFTQGIHFGVFPIDGQDISKPTLLKPGAELIAQLYRWRFAFTADLDTLSMNGPAGVDVFAYICYVIDRYGLAIGQGRGVAELRENGMNNANKTVKIAEKRAMVDAILRAANLSQAFTQDLEESQFTAPETMPKAPENTRHGRHDRCSTAQANAVRLWLHRAGKSERETVEHYGVVRLDDLPAATADRLLSRLQELTRTRRNTS